MTDQQAAKQPGSSWHLLSVDETAVILHTDAARGLAEAEAAARLGRFGTNTINAKHREPFWKAFIEELTEPMVMMLVVTGVLYVIWGELAEAVTIFVVILLLNTIEVLNELRAKQAIAALRVLAEPTATVRRDDRISEIPAMQIVPGDLVLLQAGRRVPADARLVGSYGLAVDESALTGESLPVEKSVEALHAVNPPLAERYNLAYGSTLVTRGIGTAIVVATGMRSEIGRIAGLTRAVKEPRTHLQQMMTELSKTLVWFALGFSVFVPLVGIFIAHQPPRQMLLTGLALAFATIPEEMPIIITMVLALGAFRLSRINAIAKNLHGVESLGAVTVIATDKTGTLTENRMQVVRYEPADQQPRLLETGVIANDALARGDDWSGDPIDIAVLRAARSAGIDPQHVRNKLTVVTEFTFDNARKRMAVVYRQAGYLKAAVKGAPEVILGQTVALLAGEVVLPLTDAFKRSILERTAAMAAEGLRVLALAERSLPEGPTTQELAESGLTFIGLVGLADPPRPEASAAIATCRRAGIRTLMVTGDHPATAQAIAAQVGLDGNSAVVTGSDLDNLSDTELQQVVASTAVFARTSPEHKLRIVRALQALGERVAVTGDGINDAPALTAADIGVAMGETGTDAAREAGDIVLADDNYATIVAAVEQGRLIFENLKKGVRYYLACKLALVLITLSATLLLLPVPFAPVQIILMELFMDLMAAASFTVEKAESDLLDAKPRSPQARFMDRAMNTGIIVSALGLFAAVAGVYLYTWFTTQNVAIAQTTAFLGWMIGHVLLAFNMRSERQPLHQLGLGSNRLMLAWAGAVAVFLLIVAFIPAASALLRVNALRACQWGMIIATTVVGTFWLEIRKLITYRRGKP